MTCVLPASESARPASCRYSPSVTSPTEQRDAIPRRAVTRHVAPGVHRHARRPADTRLDEGIGEAHTALRKRVEVAGGQIGVAVAAEVIGAQLVAHDEQDVANFAHDAFARFRRLSIYSAVKPDALITGPQRAVSAIMIAASCSGVVPVGS